MVSRWFGVWPVSPAVAVPWINEHELPIISLTSTERPRNETEAVAEAVAIALRMTLLLRSVRSHLQAAETV
jgi:hypothetical protein